MSIIKPINDPQLGVCIEVIPSRTANAVTHDGGVLIWQRAGRFRCFSDVWPQGSKEPCADGGIVFCRAWAVPEDRTTDDLALEHIGRRLSSGGSISHETWPRSHWPWMWVEWSDGVNNVISGIVRLSGDIIVEVEYSIHVFCDPNWATYAMEHGNAPTRFIRTFGFPDR